MEPNVGDRYIGLVCRNDDTMQMQFLLCCMKNDGMLTENEEALLGKFIDEKNMKKRHTQLKPLFNKALHRAKLTLNERGIIIPRVTRLELKTKAGVLYADLELAEEVGGNHDQLFLSFTPDGYDDIQDVACLRAEYKDLKLLVWGDSYSEDPTDTYHYYRNDIIKARNYDG